MEIWNGCWLKKLTCLSVDKRRPCRKPWREGWYKKWFVFDWMVFYAGGIRLQPYPCVCCAIKLSTWYDRVEPSPMRSMWNTNKCISFDSHRNNALARHNWNKLNTHVNFSLWSALIPITKRFRLLESHTKTGYIREHVRGISSFQRLSSCLQRLFTFLTTAFEHLFLAFLFVFLFSFRICVNSDPKIAVYSPFGQRQQRYRLSP